MLSTAACLAILSTLALPARLNAQDAGLMTTVYRYVCRDDTGRQNDFIEMRVISCRAGMEIFSTDLAGNCGYTRLGAGMV